MIKSDINTSDINSVSEEQWEALATKTIYFGHQSVGNNIIEGLTRLMQMNPAIKLNIKEIVEPRELEGPILAHSAIGQNGDPLSKIRDFKSKIEAGIGERVNIALFKFCYIDITAKSNVTEIFNHYTKMMGELQRQFPKVIFVHSTVPLMVTGSSLKNAIKKLIGRPLIQLEGNIKRNQYNRLLLDRYGAHGLVFDLAGFESMTASGIQTTFKVGEDVYLGLNPQYSSDGGHLNSVGQLAIATEFAVFLETLSNHN